MRIFFFVNFCYISIPKKVVDQGGKAEQENALFCIHNHNSTHLSVPCRNYIIYKNQVRASCMIRVYIGTSPPNPSDIVPNV